MLGHRHCLFWLVLLAGVYWLLLWQRVPVLAVISLVLSVLNVCLYRHDKQAAVYGRRRTPETMLHRVSLAGGWPGALLARCALRHKRHKPRFNRLLLASTVVNLLANGLVLYFWPQG